MSEIRIEWLTDSHWCETCGPSFAEGARVFIDDEVLLEMKPVAHCFAEDDFSTSDVYAAIIERITGHTVIDEYRQIPQNLGVNMRGDWIQTALGGQFWPIDPRPEEINPEDIAHALSLLCRFGGHCLRFYSVAEHSVLLARKASPENRLWALLHDASEAYLVDVPRPIKPFLAGYREAEEKIMKAVCSRFGIPEEMPDEIKDLDVRILTDERHQNMAPAPQPWSTDADPIGVTLQFWTPEEAKREFLAELSSHLHNNVI